MTFVEFLETLLPILLYTAGITLLVVLIIIGIKFIGTMNKLDDIVDDVDKKVKSLNGVFHIIDTTTDKISILTDKVVDVISAFVIKLFKKKYNKKEEEEENNEEE
jgi:hypothetical protein